MAEHKQGLHEPHATIIHPRHVAGDMHRRILSSRYNSNDSSLSRCGLDILSFDVILLWRLRPTSLEVGSQNACSSSRGETGGWLVSVLPRSSSFRKSAL